MAPSDKKHKNNDLKHLQVIDTLEVGEVQIAPRRLTATYSVSSSNRREKMDITYSYEEDVFDPSDSTSKNLAGIIAAQVALNYGLFCKQIVFKGSFDLHDRRFLTEMARNTAREIYVNKILQPNPFLTAEFADLRPVKIDNYLQAKLVFPDPVEMKKKLDSSGARGSSDNFTGTDRHRFAVLSSGGKESLLSYALLDELGNTVDPIFINESGGHWTTARKAYRHFRDNVPNTARVWTNADRVFPWMLRALPIVRQDFTKMRADVYPIRLWTVAVFLFGAIPLLLKRSTGRLVIGDEFDTTRRTNFSGITHYDGLYDQSRYFDLALTRYFRKKRWNIVQFSLLRPLSELLVQKVLVERYPKLQRLQMSCHSAHVHGEDIRPCGKCEKCRRVVAMLSAIDADARECGYTDEQIQNCLKNLGLKDLHQEKEIVEQVATMLASKNELPSQKIGNIKARVRPEVTKLRFDPERSPIDGIPQDLRQPLYDIVLKHVDGTVKKAGRRWVDFDLAMDPTLNSPFPFDLPGGPHEISAENGRRSYLLGELTWPRARSRFQEVDVALLPVGSLEQHGPHLPLDTDAFDAEYLARRVAEACTDPKPIVLPPINYGVSYHHDQFPGTISLSPDTLSSMVYEIGMSATRHGITKLVIINAHGGNAPALHFAAQMINRDAQIFTCVDSGETSDADIYAIAETPNDVHAGEIETSTTLATRPDLADLNAAKRNVPKFSSRYLDFTSKRSVTWYAYTRRISESGTMGDPTQATQEKGKRMWDVMVEHLSRFVEELKAMSLDEIHQRRY
ncbi:MAG: creatininase family protein [Pseudomonadota bacterium]